MYSAINNVITNISAFATALDENYNVQINYGLIDFKDLEEDGAGTTKVIKNGSSNWFTNTSIASDDIFWTERYVIDKGYGKQFYITHIRNEIQEFKENIVPLQTERQKRTFSSAIL